MPKKQKQGGTPSKEEYPPILPPTDFPETGQPQHPKLASWDLWRALGQPKKVVAPMVDGSELAWRILARRHGAELCYTPMIHSRMYAFQDKAPGKDKFRQTAFNQRCGEEGAYEIELTAPSTAAEERTGPKDTDRPLIAQFCGDDPELLLGAANDIAHKVDAVDLNLGCPQGIAKKGHYGSFLQDEWHLIFELINTLHRKCKVPVTAKMRVFNDPERTVAYAQMLERAGAQIITVHGRTRDMRAQQTGLADWEQIKLVKECVRVPVIANGNVLLPQDMDDVLAATGADGLMSAEGHLCNPALFATSLPAATPESHILTPIPTHPRVIDLAREYLDILASLKTPTVGSAVRGHMFKMLYPALAMHPQFRPRLGQAVFKSDSEGTERTKALLQVVDDLEAQLKEDEKHPEAFPKTPEEVQAQLGVASDPSKPPASDPEAKPITAFNRPKKEGHLPMEFYRLLTPASTSRPSYVAHWLAQPYLRFIAPEEEGPSLAMAMYRDKTRSMFEGKPWEPPADSNLALDAVTVTAPIAQPGQVPHNLSDLPVAKRIKVN